MNRSFVTRMLATVVLVLDCAAQDSKAADPFGRLVAINEASLIMLRETGLVPEALAKEIARGIAAVAEQQSEKGAKRSSNYLVFEKRLLEIAGREASRLHTGRSRQDIGSTMRRMGMRDAFFELYGVSLASRGALIDLASHHVDTVVPAYTHGVQAQPTSFGHYLLAFVAAFERDTQRLQEVWARLNLCPLGAAALGTSGFPLDRPRLAALLGFDAPIENSYDANFVSSVDSKLEFASALSVVAIQVGHWAQNLHTQYHDPRPWIALSADQVSGSSIMPQKRNPRPLDQLRRRATAVVSGAHGVTMMAHNVDSGMHDYRDDGPLRAVLSDAIRMHRQFAKLAANLVVDVDRARAEVDASYSTMTEVADRLLRHAELPFRDAHHFASELTDYGRRVGKRPRDLVAAEVEEVYRVALGSEIPVDVSVILAAFDPTQVIAARRGLGGTQSSEVLRMLEAAQTNLKASRAWLANRRSAMSAAETLRTTAFAALR